MTETVHQSLPDHLPNFITPPGDTDILMLVAGVILLFAVLMVGNLYLRLHSLPERMAHRSQKLQFEIVAVLGLLSLVTHMNIFWVIGLLLAMIDLPDFGTPLRRIAASAEKMAQHSSGTGTTHLASDGTDGAAAQRVETKKADTPDDEAHGHA